jgi:peptide/nickel transport system ATP-binding protein/oligopeptide transport system ATP-binding protein
MTDQGMNLNGKQNLVADIDLGRSLMGDNTELPRNGKKHLIEVKELVKYFPVRGGLLQRVVAWVQAVDNVSFFIREGETVGLVGESGCGKTTVGRTMLRLIEPTSGSITFGDTDILKLEGKELKDMRRNMQIIFQDPYASLDPRMPIGESIAEGLKIHNIGTPRERHEIVIEMLRKVGMEDYHSRRYPHEFSGGQRQRIGIARALALRPKFIVADEPVSALDVSIQSQVLNILKQLQREFGLTYLFIAHNLSVVEHISDRVAVMYLGKMVEMADRYELFRNPLHPYTQALMSAIPVPDPTLKRDRIILEGDVPSPLNPPGGCRFHPRCPVALESCGIEEPAFRQVSPDHWVACWRIE